MSVIKFSCGPSAKAAIKYYGLEEEKGVEKCVAWSSNLGLEEKKQIAQAWALTRQEFSKAGGREYYHASYNLDPSDSASRDISNEKLLQIGGEVAESLAPGHDYACFVHRDKEHPHVHVVWNTVHSETGRKYQQGPNDLERAFLVKDDIDRKHGLSLTARREVRDRIPDEAQRIHQRDPKSYLWTEDLKQRISIARDTSSTFSQYKKTLLEQGVSFSERGQDKKLTYRFFDQDGKQRAIREGRLGSDYGRQTIERGFGLSREREGFHTPEARRNGQLGEFKRGSRGDSIASSDHGGSQFKSSQHAERDRGRESKGRGGEGGKSKEAYKLSQLGRDLLFSDGKKNRGVSSPGRAALREIKSGIGETGQGRKMEAHFAFGAPCHSILRSWFWRMEDSREVGGTSFEPNRNGTFRDLSQRLPRRGIEKIHDGFSSLEKEERLEEKIEKWRNSHGSTRTPRGNNRGRIFGDEKAKPGGASGFSNRFEQAMVSAFGRSRGVSQAGLETFGRTFNEGFQREISDHERISHWGTQSLRENTDRWFERSKEHNRDAGTLKEKAFEMMTEKQIKEFQRELERSWGRDLGPDIDF